jgi:hypothetical protein
MKGRTIAAWTLGIAAAGAIVTGVMLAPSLLDRQGPDTDAPIVAAEPAPDTTPAPKPRARRSTRAKNADAAAADTSAMASTDGEPMTIAPPVVPKVAASEPELHDRLKDVLNRGAKMEIASAGFRDAEQFATVAHAARYTNVPFMVLKHRVLEEKRTLADAIRESRPEIDAERQVTRARNAARFDISVITS